MRLDLLSYFSIKLGGIVGVEPKLEDIQLFEVN